MGAARAVLRGLARARDLPGRARAVREAGLDRGDQGDRASSSRSSWSRVPGFGAEAETELGARGRRHRAAARRDLASRLRAAVGRIRGRLGRGRLRLRRVGRSEAALRPGERARQASRRMARRSAPPGPAGAGRRGDHDGRPRHADRGRELDRQRATQSRGRSGRSRGDLAALPGHRPRDLGPARPRRGRGRRTVTSTTSPASSARAGSSATPFATRPTRTTLGWRPIGPSST